MSDIKINTKHICGDDDFRTTSGTIDGTDEYFSISHDTDDVQVEIGKGSKITNYADPLILVNDGYVDLPAASAGTGFVMELTGGNYAKFAWGSDNSVTLIDSSSDAASTDTIDKLCIFDNTTSVRIKNRLGVAVRVLYNYDYVPNPITPTFKIFSELSGVDNLDPSLTINSTTVTPDFRYKGGDADGTDWNPWGYGEALNLTSTPVPSYNQGSPGLGSNDDSVKFNNGGTYYGSNASYGDVTTEDLVIELVFKTDTIGSTESIWSKRLSSGDVEGVYVYQSSSGVAALVLDPGAAAAAIVGTSTLNSNTWYHILWFVNRDEASSNGAQAYVNGFASGSGVDCTSASTTLTNSNYLRMGGNQGGGANGYQHIAFTAMWKQASWHQAGASGPAEWATIAAERFAKFAGYYPQVANGTALPTTATRAHEAYLDKIEGDYRKLYYVGDHWLRMCHRQDSNDENVYGYLSETSVVNKIADSEDFSTWTKYDVGDTVTDNAAVCPDGRTAAASLIADNDSGSHGIYTSATLTAATYTFSVFAKAGDKGWLLVQDITITGAYAYFDIANGDIGTVGGAADGYIEGPFYSGDSTPFYRCCVVFTGTAAAHSLRLRTAIADASVTFAGDGVTVNTYVWGAQCELEDYMTSPIISTTATSPVTRAQDQLRFVAGDNIGGEDVGKGTIVWDSLINDFDISSTKYFFAISDGGASSDRIYGTAVAANDRAVGYTRATPDAAVTTFAPNDDVADNTKHTNRLRWDADDVTYTLDGVDGTNTTSANMPDDLDVIDVGYLPDSTVFSANSLIQKFRIYAEPTEEG